MPEDLAQLDATAQAELVRTGEATPAELAEAAIARIEATNGEINAVIHPLFEEGLEAARGDLPDGPFKGVPFLLKDLGAAFAGQPLHQVGVQPLLQHAKADAASDVRPESAPHARGHVTPEREAPATQHGIAARAVCDGGAGFGDPLPHVVFTGGDPLRRPDLEELVMGATERGIGASLAPAVTPDLTRERLASLKAAGIQTISLSLDGSSPELHDGLLAGGVGGQVVPAQALDGEDTAVAEEFGGRVQGVFAAVVADPVDAEPGAAGRAAGRLGVEAAVGGVVVLGRAPLAHRERRHRGQRPVVRHVTDDGEPGAAVGAVDERVLVAPVGRVGQLAQAVRAGRGVRRDQGAAQPGLAFAGRDDKGCGTGRAKSPGGDPLDPGQRGRLEFQPAQELGHRGFRPLDLDEHAVEVVADQPGQPQAGGERVDERAEADALHYPLDLDRRPDRVHVTSLGPDRSPAI